MFYSENTAVRSEKINKLNIRQAMEVFKNHEDNLCKGVSCTAKYYPLEMYVQSFVIGRPT